MITFASFMSDVYLEDDPAIVFWSTGSFIQKQNRYFLWIADRNEHVIKVIEKNVVNIAVGQIGKALFRNGDATNAGFNTPSAVVVYNSTKAPGVEDAKYIPHLFNSTVIECIFADANNYTQCVDNVELIKGVELDRNRVKLIRSNEPISETESNTTNATNSNATTNETDNQTKFIFQFLFISDKSNNCIRKVDLLIGEVTTYAGVCGSSGFKDGPPGTNRFNQPDGLGIDEMGNLFVYDEGNRYIRFISTNGTVSTLINGACFEYQMNPPTFNDFGVKPKEMLCFRNWIKTKGLPSEHIVGNINNDKCLKFATECGYISALISNKNTSLN